MRKQCSLCPKSYVDNNALEIHKKAAHNPNRIDIKERLSPSSSPGIVAVAVAPAPISPPISGIDLRDRLTSLAAVASSTIITPAQVVSQVQGQPPQLPSTISATSLPWSASSYHHIYQNMQQNHPYKN
jgi:hypothetical protein